ncbi:MAG: molybdopterin-dependent oxidoreductase, partial [Gammaproteobacteria bacterium]|nr:molybdopterin-dependent oxidoreductase [Gammaproteobacteria bacterium]
PFRYSTRSWEMQQRDGIAVHDCIGSNTHLHVKSGKVMRVVPKDNEAINETWLSDRDRFSYQGLNSDDRATQPMVKENGSWKTVDWETALNKAFTGLNKALNSDIEKVGFLSTPNSTTEELYLLQKLARSQGVENIDHRLRQQDFSTESQISIFPSLGCSIADLEKLNAAFFIGANVRKEQPIAGHRIRKAALSGGAISFINSRINEVRFPTLANIAASPAGMIEQLKGILSAAVALNKNASISESVKTAINKVKANDEQIAIAKSLVNGDSSSVILGIEVLNSVNRGTIETLASAIADATSSTLGYLTEGANAAGAHIAGALPYRTVAGTKTAKSGLNAQQMLDQDLSAYVLLGLEAEFDVANPVSAVSHLEKSDCVISLTSFVTDSIKQYSDVILPVCNYAETAGTIVNAAGDWQSFNGAVPPVGEARPAWKVLRVLGNLFEADGFDYISVEDIFNELDGLMQSAAGSKNVKNNSIGVDVKTLQENGLSIVGGTGVLSGDAIVRRATALQETKDEIADVQIALSPSTANSLGLENYDIALVKQGGNEVSVIVWIDEQLADQCVSIPMGTSTSALLGAQSDAIVVEKTTEPEIDEEEMVRASNA